MSATDELTAEGSQTSLVAISSAMEESAVNICFFLYIIHENRKTADNIRTVPLSREFNYLQLEGVLIRTGEKLFSANLIFLPQNSVCQAWVVRDRPCLVPYLHRNLWCGYGL